MGDLDHLFEQIAAGEIPSYKIYEDDLVYVFLDINPGSRGHTLVIPKVRAEFVHEMPEETAAAIGRILPRIAHAIMQAVDADAYNILNNNGATAGQVVPHVHFHIIPRFINEPKEQAGMSFTWSPGTLSEHDAKELQTAIVAELH